MTDEQKKALVTLLYSLWLDGDSRPDSARKLRRLCELLGVPEPGPLD